MNPKRTIAPDGSAIVDTAALVREQWALIERISGMEEFKPDIAETPTERRLREDMGRLNDTLAAEHDIAQTLRAELSRLRAELAEARADTDLLAELVAAEFRDGTHCHDCPHCYHGSTPAGGPDPNACLVLENGLEPVRCRALAERIKK